MDQSLRVKHSQHLVMTMQMRQAVQLLQMSAQELRETVEKEYMENPALELEDNATEVGGAEEIFPSDEGADGEEGAEERGARPFGGEMAPSGKTLEEELMEQVEFSFPEGLERQLAVFMAGSVDERGYLAASIPEIMKAVGAEEAAVMAVLHRFQGFEPAGVGARDLRECLRLQAERKGIYEGLVAAIIDDHLEEVAKSRIRDIAAAEQAKAEDVQRAVDLIRTLNPKPGSSYGRGGAGYIRPDVLVQRDGEDYRVLLNDDALPKLCIAKMYRNPEALDEEAKRYIRQRLRAASWLIRGIEERRRTVCRVMEEIVRRQRSCMEHGMSHLLPMTMKQVAEGIGIHESTVSRAAAKKYAELPWGIVPLRAFFTANLGTSSPEEEYAALQVKAAMEEFLRREDPRKPLSDQKLAELLEERGMRISRRTVMKYREQMGYPSSVKRKRYG